VGSYKRDFVKPSRDAEFEGMRVLITKGTYAGCEGICLGRANGEKKFAVSPDGAAEILNLDFEDEFSLLIDLSGDPSKN